MTPVGATVDPLADLRGYRLPDAPSWWPPAPGWWLLALVLLVLGALGVWWMLRRRRRHAAARQARRELAHLRSNMLEHGASAAHVRELSRLLRRYAVAAFPQRKVASLTGEEWLQFLDQHGGGERFRKGPGRQLVDAPYRAESAASANELAALVEEWIHYNREIPA